MKVVSVLLLSHLILTAVTNMSTKRQTLAENFNSKYSSLQS